MNNLARHSPQMSDAEIEFAAAEFRARADVAFQMHGLRAPQLRADEDLTGYRRRLLRNLAPKSGPEYAGINFNTLNDSTLTPLETLMIDNAVAAFKASTGPLRSLTVKDASGREALHWFGDSAECWEPFRQPTRIAEFNSDLRRGADSPSAIRPVEMLMSDGSTRRVL